MQRRMTLLRGRVVSGTGRTMVGTSAADTLPSFGTEGWPFGALQASCLPGLRAVASNFLHNSPKQNSRVSPTFVRLLLVSEVHH